MIRKKPQYQQENFVRVVVGNCWDKIRLEVITGPGVPSLHPCHPRWDPAVSLSSCFLYSPCCPIAEVLPIYHQKEESCGFVLRLPRDGAVIYLADTPRTRQQRQKRVCYKWFFSGHFLHLLMEEKQRKMTKSPAPFLRTTVIYYRRTEEDSKNITPVREGNSISSKNKQPGLNKPSENCYCSFPQKSGKHFFPLTLCCCARCC